MFVLKVWNVMLALKNNPDRRQHIEHQNIVLLCEVLLVTVPNILYRLSDTRLYYLLHQQNYSQMFDAKATEQAYPTCLFHSIEL